MAPGFLRSAGPRWRGVVRGVVIAVLVLLALPYVIAPFYRVINPISTLMLWRWTTGQRVERMTVPLSRIARALPLTVINSEDARFCSHHGVDFLGLQNAVENADDGEPLRGGSTITQQLAKNLFLWPGRSYVRKALEFPLALWIDLVLPKSRILEIYLNVVEWGPNGEFGAEAAARRAFGKAAANLTAREAALLAAMLPNPRNRDARRPGRGLSALAQTYERRAAKGGYLALCLRPGIRRTRTP